MTDRLPSRQGLLFAISSRYSSRFHMSLIVLASVAVALLATKSLYLMGIDALWARWIPALAAAYGAFFIGVWAWLHLSAYGRHLRAERVRAQGQSFDGGIDIPNVGTPDFSLRAPAPSSFSGDGGTFDGGGASGSWGDAMPSIDVADVGGDEGGLLLVVAIGLLVLALVVLFGAAGLVIWEAPVILAEVVFEVLLASSLVRGAHAVESQGWISALFARTWKSFVFICVAVLLFAVFAHNVTPHAHTAAEVIRTLAKK